MTGRLLQMSGAVVDLVYTVEAVPRPGDDAVVSDFTLTPGGGFNAMVAARRAGMDVRYGGPLGSGPFANIVEAGLDAEGISILQTRDPHHDQGCCTVMIDAQGERTFVAGEGAEAHLTADALTRIDVAGADWTLLSGYALCYAGAREALTHWLRSDAPIAPLVFDPTPMVAELHPARLGAVLARAAWVTANRREAAVITSLTEASQAALALAEGRSGGAVVRTGAEGCVVAVDGRSTEIPGFPVEAIDTNGAGDTHIGSFIAELARRKDPLAAALYANAAAALSTTSRGPATAPLPQAVATLMAGSGRNSRTA
ncbi:MAG: PfkB family carbohydrate kinase [Pseudomonadota bacterium]